MVPVGALLLLINLRLMDAPDSTLEVQIGKTEIPIELPVVMPHH